MIKKAILHVENSDKLVDFAKYLTSAGWTILSANKTEEQLRNNKIPVQQEPALVESNYYVNESYQLIKNLLLTKYDQSDYSDNQDQDEENNIFILCVNITPTVNSNIISKNQTTPIRPLNLYISTVLKSAFVNYENILILTDPEDYDEAIIQLKTDNITKEFRTYLAAKALNLVSAYDGGLSISILQNKLYHQYFLPYLTMPFKRHSELKQGSNAHQLACMYKAATQYDTLDNFLKLSGQQLSYNLLADISFAWEQIGTLFSILKNQFVIKSVNCDGYEFSTQFTPLTGTVFTMAVKLNSIVGAALSTNVLDSFRKTYTYDTENITEAVFASSAVIDKSAAEEIVKCNFAAIVAPGYTPEAKTILSENPATELVSATKANRLDIDGKIINGGLIVQRKDTTLFDHWIVKTKKRPTQHQIDEMALGMLLVMGSRSYSAVLIKNNAVVGISEACPSKVQAMDELYSNTNKRSKLNNYDSESDTKSDSIQSGAMSGANSSPTSCPATQSESDSIGNVLVCDAAIEFCDSVKKLIDEGITAIIHTGGTSADNEFINYCDEKGISMVFTEMTHIKF